MMISVGAGNNRWWFYFDGHLIVWLFMCVESIIKKRIPIFYYTHKKNYSMWIIRNKWYSLARDEINK